MIARTGCRPVYAIGDVHGDAERLMKVLSAHGLVDVSAGRVCWTQPNVDVVLMGDVTDAKSRNGDDGDALFEGSFSDLWILEFVRLAAEEAKKVNSTLVVLLGNHELMNYRGDFRYASPHHARNLRSRLEYFQKGAGYRALTSVFVTTVTYNGVIYAHAGIPIDPTPTQLKLLDKRVNADLLGLDDVSKDLEDLVSHRDYFAPGDANDAADTGRRLARILDARGVKRMVVGHNYTHGSGVVSDYGGRLVFSDVGISKAFAPNISAACMQIVYDPGDGALRAMQLDGTTRPIPPRR